MVQEAECDHTRSKQVPVQAWHTKILRRGYGVVTCLEKISQDYTTLRKLIWVIRGYQISPGSLLIPHLTTAISVVFFKRPAVCYRMQKGQVPVESIATCEETLLERTAIDCVIRMSLLLSVAPLSRRNDSLAQQRNSKIIVALKPTAWRQHLRPEMASG